MKGRFLLNFVSLSKVHLSATTFHLHLLGPKHGRYTVNYRPRRGGGASLCSIAKYAIENNISTH